eukprot:CAMPEP_0182527198 /NCGR_PEP_ID=MMETSP1323-20130603/3698_1 /TAXON_ID=236787 /ORGANISM="Florenciella parvula, Strain RCC1693" /LENGTH=42 /DNA_ID= /DNA_START= /DNA_END= /DNA_ORIENTATION=
MALMARPPSPASVVLVREEQASWGRRTVQQTALSVYGIRLWT